jgi:DNA-binding PadR family transcriptional regulator
MSTIGTSRPRSPLAMVLLASVAEAPMHPYRMQQLIKERGKDKIANVAQRNSVYQTIEHLHRAGLIAVRATAREERRPERTVYEITDRGAQTLQLWLRTMLSTPERDFPDFPAALSFLPLLTPADVLSQLEARAQALVARLEDLDTPEIDLPRLFLVEDEYQRAVVEAELDWVRSLVDDLRSGRLTWSDEWARGYEPEGAAPTSPDGTP